MEMQMATVDLTPTWQDVLPAMLAVIQNPKAPQKSRTAMYVELGRMAQAADAYVFSKRGVLHQHLPPEKE
jgi:hypothetical protein